MLQDNQKPKAIKEKLLSFLENDNPFFYTKNIIDTQVDEIEFTKKYLLQNLKPMYLFALHHPYANKEVNPFQTQLESRYQV